MKEKGDIHRIETGFHPKYYVVYKPFGMLSQFSVEGDKPTLASLFSFPRDVYPVGRLDVDSEGLLIITNDKFLNHKLLNPGFRHKRTYLAQVDGMITSGAIDQLKKGVTITVGGKPYHTIPAEAGIVDVEPVLPPRNPPIRYRKNIPVSWIELTLSEGKNRQVRKMTSAVGFPTLRLVRTAIEALELSSMQPGEVRQFRQEDLYNLLNLNPSL